MVVMNAFIKCEGGGYDYDNPEQYRPLLTRDKVEFIEQNDEFLEQYQTMTCRCCSKYFSTYKNFMAHVRKKYPLLPRNLCFNCLKMNDSKALFISHLKKRNCINLFRVLNALRGKTTAVVVPSVAEDVADDVGATGGVVAVADAGAGVVVTMTSPTVTVSGGGEAVTPGGGSERPEKLRAKELLVNKLYECKLCPKGFRTKHEFRTHVYDKHADVQRKDNNSIQCSFCGLDFADPVDRRRHPAGLGLRLHCATWRECLFRCSLAAAECGCQCGSCRGFQGGQLPGLQSAVLHPGQRPSPRTESAPESVPAVHRLAPQHTHHKANARLGCRLGDPTGSGCGGHCGGQSSGGCGRREYFHAKVPPSGDERVHQVRGRRL